jgi:L-proline amide hydrolase
MTRPATTEGTIPFLGHQTWYRVTGNLNMGGVPLVVLHGGPGCTHDYLLRQAALVDTGRAVVHYDQLGNGRSTHLPDAPADFWTPELFLAELANLLAELGIANRYALLGQSWGGMLAAEHAVTRPAGLRALVIADSPASMALWSAAAGELRADLPPDVDAVLREHEAAATTDSAAYQEAMQVFYAKHVCRTNPMPDEVVATFAAMDEDPTVYQTMNGPSEFHVVGSLRDWTIVDRLGSIAVPTLLASGRYDEATTETIAPYFERIPDVRWSVFAESSHMPNVEETESFNAVVADFLASADK